MSATFTCLFVGSKRLPVVVFMYLHIGQDFILNDKDIMGVFDFDNISTSGITMEFLKRLEQEDSLISISDEIPKSFVLTLSGGVEIGYLSPLNSRTIIGRAPYHTK